MVVLDDGVYIVDIQRSDVTQLLDLGCDFLDLIICQVQVQLVHSRLDGVPAGQPVGEMDVSLHTEIVWIQYFVGGWICQNGLGVDAGLVGEGTETRDWVVEGDVDLDGVCYQILNVSDLVQLVFGLDILWGGHNHTSHQTTQWGDTVSLTDPQDTDVDQTGTTFQGGVGVGDGATGVVVEMAFDVARDNTLQGSDQFVHLSWVGAADGVGYTDSVDTDLGDGLVDVQQVDQVASEGVLGGESNLDALGLDELDDLDGALGDVVHVLAVGVLSQELGGADDDVNTVYPGLDGNLGVVHVATDVRQDLGLQAQFADGLTVLTGLLGGHWRGQFDVIDTEVVQGLGDFDLLLLVEEGVGKLLTFTQGGVDQLEVVDVGQEVGRVGPVRVLLEVGHRASRLCDFLEVCIFTHGWKV